MGDLYLCSLIGIGVTALLFVITDYYTSTRFAPVKKTAARVADRPRDEHHPGPRAGPPGHGAAGARARARHPRLLEGGGRRHRGIYGIGVAVMGQLSLTGLIVALDAFGPITDNAGGIAEMADLPEEVRNVTDPLDAVGNTTKAVTKGYAIGSAVLAAVVLFAAFKARARRRETAQDHRRSRSTTRRCSSGLLIGGLMVYLFAALSMEAVGRAGGAVVEEVRRQFREKPGIMEGTEQPDYATVRRHRDQGRAARDDHPGADPDPDPADRRPDRRAGARRPADRRDRRRASSSPSR